MKIFNKDLRKANKWLASGRYTKVIHFLEPKVPIFIEDPLYYAILGRACMEAGTFKDAETYLSRGLQADPVNLYLMQLLAVNYLKRKDPSSAIRIWLEILDEYPQDKYAKKGLAKLKKISTQEEQDYFLENFNYRKFIPDSSAQVYKYILAVLIIVLLGLSAFYFRTDLYRIFRSTGINKTVRGNIDFSITGNPDLLIDPDADALYPMSAAQVSLTMKKALKYFQNYNDNMARYELNKIIYSNASLQVKSKAEGLRKALGEPTIETLKTNFDYKDVVKEPWLYDGCYVIWKGMTANVVYDNDAILFDFLVGFDSKKVLEGKVRVKVPFVAVMEPLPLELFAQIKVKSADFYLEARTLHFLRTASGK